MIESKVFGDSAFTLRHKRTSTYSFSRATRFRSQKRPDNSEFLVLPSTLDKRTTTLGFGQRLNLAQKGRFDSPAPGTYDLPSSFDLKSGPKFKKSSPGRYSLLDEPSPGPGSYNVRTELGKNAPKFTFRPKNILTKYNDSPSPNTYLPSLVQTAAFKNISFGIGERAVKTQSRFNSPGPGTYEIPSDFAGKK